MAFKMKGMGFGEGTGYKSPQAMKKESAMKRVPPGKKSYRKVEKKLTEKSRYTDRTPQSQMSDMERAAVKGISKPQSVKNEPPRRRYGDSPNKMAKKSAMKKKGLPKSPPKTTTTTRPTSMSNYVKGALGIYRPDQMYSKLEGREYDTDKMPESIPQNKNFKKDFMKAQFSKVLKDKVKRASDKKSPNAMKKGSAMKKKSGSKKIFRKRKLTAGLEGNIKQIRNPLTGNVRTTKKVKNPLTGKTRKTVVTSKKGVKKDFEK